MQGASSKDPRAQARVRAKWEEVQGLDAWGVLGVAPGASTDDVKRAYHALAREFHTDAFGEGKLGEVAPLLDELFARISDAYNVLTDPHKRAELDALNAMTAAGQSTDLGALLDAEQDFAKGKLLLERGEAVAAARFIGKATAANPANDEWRAYELYASWWQTRDLKDAPRRIGLLEKLAKDDERLLIALVFAGRLWLEVGELDKAMKLLKRVTREDPKHAQANRELRLVNRKLEESKKKTGLFAKLFGKK